MHSPRLPVLGRVEKYPFEMAGENFRIGPDCEAIEPKFFSASVFIESDNALGFDPLSKAVESEAVDRREVLHRAHDLG